jgi:HD-GYP domain-containing protein (c-di-GMP phosphodiesterase class II)
MEADGLRRAVRLSLLWRLGAVALAVGVLVAGLALTAERHRLNGAVANLARVEAARFRMSIVPELSRPALDAHALQAALEAYAGQGASLDYGRFVLALIRDPDGNIVARIEDPAFEDIDGVRAALDTAAWLPPPDGGYRARSLRLGTRPYVAVTVPLTDEGGAVRAWLGGAFAVSPAAVTELRANVLQTVLVMAGIVLITALALYPLITGLLDRVTRLAGGLLDANLETLQVLGGAIAKRDSDTDAHNYRVTVYSVRLAEAAGLGPEQMQSLIKGALLHDVGKLGIRDTILLKPGRLDAAEFAVMQTHVDHGLDITGRAHWLTDAGQVVGAHHEKFDGSGYPRGLTGLDIPITARMFAIADVFDALTSERPYKAAMPLDDALQLLEQGRGTHFDPNLLDLFAPIAPELHREFGDSDGVAARLALEALTRAYFLDAPGATLRRD